MLSRDFPLAAKEAWYGNKSTVAQSSSSAHRSKVWTCQKFLIRAVRATDFRRGAATVAPVLGSALFGETVAAPYVGGTYSAPSDLFLRSMSMDRLVAMEAFVLVVDTGSFSAAARRLHVGQPAVSKLVAQLEERLGVKLLVRTTRGLPAT